MSKVNNRHNINFYQSIIERIAFRFLTYVFLSFFLHFMALNTLVGFRERRKICTHSWRSKTKFNDSNFQCDIRKRRNRFSSILFILHTFHTFIWILHVIQYFIFFSPLSHLFSFKIDISSLFVHETKTAKEY